MGGFLIGGLEEIRTPDPHNANVVRSQLRYKPVAYASIIPPANSVVKISRCNAKATENFRWLSVYSSYSFCAKHSVTAAQRLAAIASKEG